MERPATETVLMGCAWLWSERSTCTRLQVGAVFARDGRILATGYNGAPAGLPHCNHACTCGFPGNPNMSSHLDFCPSQQACFISEHAERNAVAFAARHGIALEGSHMYVTHMPCAPCAMSIINAGIERVIYQQPYRDESGVKLLLRAGLGVAAWPFPGI